MSLSFTEKGKLKEDVTLLGEAFKAAGFRTGLFSSNGYVSKGWGFARGFDVEVSSDHGEEFGEYGRFGWGISVNEELVDVPLIIGYGPWTRQGLRITRAVELVDLLPTLLEAVGARQTAPMARAGWGTCWMSARAIRAWRRRTMGISCAACAWVIGSAI